MSGQSSSGSDSEVEPDWDGVLGADRSWVSTRVLNTPSIWRRGDDIPGWLSQLVGHPGHQWGVKGLRQCENAASVPSKIRFIMYTNTLRDIQIRPPFTAFQRMVLRSLSVAPSQLHVNAWAFLKVFELVLAILGRDSGYALFFKLFELSRTPEKSSDPVRWEQVSFKKRQDAPKIFKPYCDSAKTWRDQYVWVVPECEDALASIVSFDENEEVCGSKFPLAWTYAHYRDRPPITYRTSGDLAPYDEESLYLLENVASWLPGRQIECRRLAQSSSCGEFESILGAVWTAGDWQTPLGEMSKTSFESLFRDAKKLRKPVPAPNPVPRIEEVPEIQAGASVPQGDLSRGGESTTRDKRKRDQRGRQDGDVEVTTVDEAAGRAGKHTKGSSPSLADFDPGNGDPLLLIAELAKTARSARRKDEDRIKVLKGQLEESQKKLQSTLGVLEPTSKKLSDAESTIRTLRKERDTAVRKLEAETSCNKELSEEVKYLTQRFASEKADHDELKVKVMDYCEQRFEMALKQVNCMHPELEFDREVIHFSHSVEDGCIFQPEELDDEGEVVTEKKVVWRSHR